MNMSRCIDRTVHIDILTSLDFEICAEMHSICARGRDDPRR